MSLDLLRAPWALTDESHLRDLLERWPSAELLAAVQSGQRAIPVEAATRNVEIQAAAGDGGGGGLVAVIPIAGLIFPRVSPLMAFFGAVSTAGISARLRAAIAEPAVKAVVLDFSSHGGTVHGVTELAREIRAARAAKPIVAQANHVAASAAYWLGSAAHEFVGAPSSLVGSVGVYAVHEDRSEADAKAGIKREIIAAGEHKADQVDGAPLSDEGRAAAQRTVDHFYALFVADVAEGRGVSKETVRKSYGKGLALTAPAALEAGMLDRVATLEETIARLSSHQGRRAAMKAEALADDGDADRRLRRARLAGA